MWDVTIITDAFLLHYSDEHPPPIHCTVPDTYYTAVMTIHHLSRGGTLFTLLDHINGHDGSTNIMAPFQECASNLLKESNSGWRRNQYNNWCLLYYSDEHPPLKHIVYTIRSQKTNWLKESNPGWSCNQRSALTEHGSPFVAWLPIIDCSSRVAYQNQIPNVSISDLISSRFRWVYTNDSMHWGKHEYMGRPQPQWCCKLDLTSLNVLFHSTSIMSAGPISPNISYHDPCINGAAKMGQG